MRHIANQSSILRPTLIIALCLLAVAACHPAHAQPADTTLVLLDCDTAAATRQVVALIEQAGGRAAHIFPPHVLICDLPQQAALTLAGDPRVYLLSTSYLDPADVPTHYGRAARDAVIAWNDVFVSVPASLDALPDDPPGDPLVGDALLPIDETPFAPRSPIAAAAPPGAVSWQTSEYMMGSVTVSLILPESDGTVDANTEDWTSGEQSNVASETLAGLTWWASHYPYSVSPLSFTWIYNYSVPTDYEPITRPHTDQGLWIADALTELGYSCTSSTYFSTSRTYVNDLRNNNNTDWAFIIFVVDSTNDADQKFSDSYFGYAYLGGPFTVMTYGNDGWGIARMDRVTAHETGHIFRAGDEYSGCSSSNEYGYLKIQNTNCGTNPTCVMNSNVFSTCSVTEEQLGWRDTDTDGVPDILDVAPTASLNTYLPDPTTDPTPTYTGSASISFYPNQLNPGYDVTLNRIASVQYRIDGGAWQNASASDGAFDEATESYTFTTSVLADGLHTFQTRAIDTSGNLTASLPSDTLTIDAHDLTVTASASPSTIATAATTSLSASALDASAHGIASWAWNDNGGGGSFSPSAAVQNPTYTAPANTGDANLFIMLTVTATCDGAIPISDSDSTILTVQPVPHTFSVTAASPNPFTVTSGGASLLSASFSDGRPAHSVASWSWSDGGAGGSFSPSAAVQSPTYTAPANTGGSDLSITLTVTATCDGASPLADSDTAGITVTYDWDGDGLPDYWEMTYGLDETDPSDPPNDPDNDGLTNLDEYNNNTDPAARDTDGDGFGDGEEVDLGSLPDDDNDTPPSGHFTDVPITGYGPQGDQPFWAFHEIEACVRAGIVSGYTATLYKPSWSVARDQMAVFISRALAGGNANVPDFSGQPTFADVDSNYWAFKYIEYAAAQNIVAGYLDGYYHPEYTLDRGQMAVFIARSVVTPTGEAGLASYTPPLTPTFPDVTPDGPSAWCYKHVEYLAAQGIVHGYSDGYHPEYTISRDQMAVYLARAFELPR